MEHFPGYSQPGVIGLAAQLAYACFPFIEHPSDPS
jgi:hypothetical protein